MVEEAISLLKPTFSPASLKCRASVPLTRTVASSMSIGWRSVLVEQHTGLSSVATEVFETAPTPDQTIVVLTSGSFEIDSFNRGVWRRAAYQAGTVGLTPPWKTDRLRRHVKRNQVPYEKVNVYLPQILLAEARDRYFRKESQCRTDDLSVLAFQDPLVSQIALALLRGVRAAAPDLYAESLAQMLVVHLFANHSPWRRYCDVRDRVDIISDRRLARVLEYMSYNMAESLSLDELANEAAVSKFHFVRLFKQRLGLTPHAYLVRLRLEAAQRLLRATEMNISIIASQCGFRGPSHFSTVFNRHTGLSPTAFRQG